MSYKLIISVVPQYKGDLITNTARDAGCPGGTVLMGTETSANGLVQLLGFGDAPKEITYNLTPDDKAPAVISAIKNVTGSMKKNFGILFSIAVDEFFKAGDRKIVSSEKGEKKMTANDYEMINVIVNKGYAEDAMAAARKAGAGGGTIIQAHGTAKEGDAKFFGSEIVPEKDMLVILVPADKKSSIIKAISELDCFKTPGSGIIFCNEVKDFTVLGKN